MSVQSRRRIQEVLVPFSLFLLLAAGTCFAQQGGPRLPMHATEEDGAQSRWLQKQVLDSRLLDGMEDLAQWSLKGEGEMALSDLQVKEGKYSLRISSSRNLGRVDGSGDWQDLVATRRFPSEDWSRFNRLSIWVYPDVVGAPALSATLVLHNEGAHLLPDSTNEGRNESIPLKNRQWNHVVWEITPLDRDKVTGVDFAYSMPKMFPDPGDRTALYIDQLELQKVVPDYVEGWEVAPGKIAFSHAGYESGSTKTALASGLADDSFSVVDADTGKVVLTRPVEQKESTLGRFQVLDFSEIEQAGHYFLRSGTMATRPFQIGGDTWRESILKVANFLYTERCGTVIPGIHGICHQDDYTVHGDKRIVVNGGYHDAGDLTATGNTVEISYALFEYVDRLQRQGEDTELRDRLLEEAKWGLNWLLKTRFGDGYRSTGQLISYWTNGIMGDADDRFGEAVNDPEWNFRVAAVEALAARVLRAAEPDLADRCLATAEEDWRFGMQGMSKAAPLPEIYGQKDELERSSFAALASIELFETTREQQYSNAAVTFADDILASQERHIQKWTIPMTGYFYTNSSRDNLFHRFHIGQEEEPIVALAHLCNALPENPKWMKWYSAIVLHSKYYQQVAAHVDSPFNVLPASIYRESESKQLPLSKTWTPLRAADRDSFSEQVRRGIPLGGDYYLRRFPVWFDFRGNSSVLLSQAKALSVAGQLRGDVDAVDLAQQQAQWIVGRNSFSSSIMYGEGYDWTPLYSVRSGQLVGAIPVGIETRGNADAPYWPNQSCWTYKEVWSQPAGEWIWLMRDLSGPAVIEISADANSGEPVTLVNGKTGAETKATLDSANGHFRASVPQGNYALRQGNAHQALSVLPAGTYEVNLRSDVFVDFTVGSTETTAGSVEFHLSADGAGSHTFSIRVDNLLLTEPQDIVMNLGKGSKAESVWHARISDSHSPWTAVVLPDHSINNHRELTGIAHELER